MNKKKIKIFITGNLGFIGTFLSESLIEMGHTIFGFDKKQPSGSERYKCIQGNILDAELLKELCIIGKTHKHTITIETEGSEFVQTVADCISLSPKLSNSTPRPGTWMPFADREVTEKDKEQHEKWRCNYDAMKQLIKYHPDYQLKPVISNKKDLIEVKYIQNFLVPSLSIFIF